MMFVHLQILLMVDIVDSEENQPNSPIALSHLDVENSLRLCQHVFQSVLHLSLINKRTPNQCHY